MTIFDGGNCLSKFGDLVEVSGKKSEAFSFFGEISAQKKEKRHFGKRFLMIFHFKLKKLLSFLKNLMC